MNTHQNDDTSHILPQPELNVSPPTRPPFQKYYTIEQKVEAPPAIPPQENAPEKEKSWAEKMISKGGFIGIALGLLFKFKYVFAMLKFGKFFATFASMFLMIYVYAQLYGWPFGVGFVVLVLIHEMGHFFAAKYWGLNVGAPIFIPFLGAFISMKEMPRDAAMEAKVALGGPVLGSLASLLCVPLYLMTRQDLFLALAYSGFMINLFNLIPVHPLDGGRAVSAISPWLWAIGIPLTLVASFYMFNPIIILFLILGAGKLFRLIKDKNKDYYQVPFTSRLIFGSIYFSLLIGLGVGMVVILGIHQIHLQAQ